MKIYIKELDGYSDRPIEESNGLINKYYHAMWIDNVDCDSYKDIDFKNPNFPYVEYGGDMNQVKALVDRLKAAGFTIEVVDI